MSNLISLENVSLAYGLEPLLDKAALQIRKGERVCIIGRNGAGKSSLLKIIEGVIQPDSGQVWRQPQLRIARLAQELPENNTLTVYDYVAEGLSHVGVLLAEYHSLTHSLSQQSSKQTFDRLEQLQQLLDANQGWQYEQTIKTILTRLELDPDRLLHTLSGGWQRRAALAKALVVSPDLLLLDEPTNHLDIEAIQWLEEQLLSSNVSLVFITHDRALLKRLATEIVELDRGQLTVWPGDYDNFLRRKEELLHAEEKQNALFDKKLAQEEVWIRQGIKARRTRNEGRVRALYELRRVRSKRREVEGRAQFGLNEAGKSGDLVIEAHNVSHQLGNQCIINNFSTRIMRGDRIGLVGPNGIGKSTLLNILLGSIQPDQGEVNLGTRLDVAYFDQKREALDLNKSVMDNVVDGKEFIEVNGSQQHVISYLAKFLFTRDRALTPVKALSGGECNRLLLARLFSRPANLLVMDEPTNDLDIETLELLEELLSQFQGTLLIVSHDREFLDNVVTSLFVFEGQGKMTEYVGSYHDWLQQKQPEKTVSGKPVEQKIVEPVKAPTKLSYKDQRELDALPLAIEKMEAKQQTIQQKIAEADFYKQSPAIVAETMAELAALEVEIKKAYERWDYLEGLAAQFKR